MQNATIFCKPTKLVIILLNKNINPLLKVLSKVEVCRALQHTSNYLRTGENKGQPPRKCK